MTTSGSRATDIIRRRRARAAYANRRSARLLRFVAGLALVGALATVLAAAAGTAAVSSIALAFLRDLPDAAALAELPAVSQPSPATVRIFAPDSADPDSAPLLLDTIRDPRPAAGWVAYDDLPPLLVSATLAVEDSAYWTAAAPRLEQALLDWARDGSTSQPISPLVAGLVTRQLRDGQPPANARAAAQDWLLGWQISRAYPRETVVEWVLNSRYYGYLAYGVAAASEVYFGKPVTELTLGEAALLAGIGRNPAANPFDDPAAARRAQAVVLAAMMQQQRATANATIYAQQTLLQLTAPPGSGSSAPAIAALVRRELAARLGPDALLVGDLTVTTTFDPATQAALDALAPANDGPWAAVALDSATGAIRALAGEPPTTPHPTGSLLRPFITLAALSQGSSAATGLIDTAAAYDALDLPLPPGDTAFAGPLRLREAAASGATGPALQLLRRAGPTALAETTAALGLPAAFPAPGALATAEGGPASPLAVAQAFGTLANAGMLAGVRGDDPAALPQPTTLEQIVDADGRVLYQRAPVEWPVITPPLAWLLNDILRDGLETSAADAVTLTGRAGEAMWQVAYRPEGVIVRWTAASDPGPELVARLPGDGPAAWPRPAGLVERTVCELSGLLPPRSPNGRALCPTVEEWFIPGTEPATVDDWHRTVTVNRANGRRATIFTPPRLVEERKVLALPPEAQAWAAANGLPLPPAEYDGIGRLFTRRGDAAAVTTPAPFETVSGTVTLTGIAAGDDFAVYRVTVFPGLTPAAVTLLAESETPQTSGELAAWDTTTVPDGLYTLLLTVIRQDNSLIDIAIPVTVANGGGE